MSGIQFDNGGVDAAAAAAAVEVRASVAVDGLDALSVIPGADEGLPPISLVLRGVAADGNLTDGDMTGGDVVDSGSSYDDDDDDDETVKAVGITSTGKTEIVPPQVDPRLGREKRKDEMARLATEALASPRQETGDSMASGPIELRWLPRRQRARSCPLPASTLQRGEALKSLALYSALFSTLGRDVEELRMALSAPSPRGDGALDTLVLYSAFFSALERDAEAVWRGRGASLEWDDLSALSLQEGETPESPVLNSVPSTLEEDVQVLLNDVECGREWAALCATLWP